MCPAGRKGGYDGLGMRAVNVGLFGSLGARITESEHSWFFMEVSRSPAYASRPAEFYFTIHQMWTFGQDAVTFILESSPSTSTTKIVFEDSTPGDSLISERLLP